MAPFQQTNRFTEGILTRMTSVQRARYIRLLLLICFLAVPLLAQQPHRGGGEANLILPDLDQAVFFGGIGGRALLMTGLLVCALGLVFGLGMYKHLRNLPVHASMLEISELIYETCKTYLHHAGQVPDDPGDLHRRRSSSSISASLRQLRRVQGPRSFCCSAWSASRGSYRRGVVRHPREHVRELADGVRQPARQAVPVLRHSAARPA